MKNFTVMDMHVYGIISGNRTKTDLKRRNYFKRVCSVGEKE
jgi:hypothetical protein